ncbi:MAG: M42 family peptidase [Clostridia bacterium]|nr:M42 family peptidase [Clostridia bacterium]
MDLKQLTDIHAVSGHEQALRRALLAELKDMGLSPRIDRAGNVIVEKQGTDPNGKRVMLSAHMDEVGFIVTSCTSEGFLRIAPCGGIDPRVVISKRVLVGDELIPGVIGAMAIHLQSAADRKRVLDYSDIYVDIGAKDKEEAESKAPKGTYIAFDTDYVLFGDGFVSAKALDDRVGIYTILRLLKEDFPCTIAAAFTSQEEVGCRGGQAAAFGIAPDIGIALEGTTCNDLGDVPATAQVCNAGQGVCVSFMDRASIANRDLFRKTVEIGDAQQIPYQIKRGVAGGNEGGVMQRTRAAVPTVVLSVPCRYIHSPSSVCKLSDIDSQFLLAKALLKTL